MTDAHAFGPDSYILVSLLVDYRKWQELMAGEAARYAASFLSAGELDKARFYADLFTRYDAAAALAFDRIRAFR